MAYTTKPMNIRGDQGEAYGIRVGVELLADLVDCLREGKTPLEDALKIEFLPRFLALYVRFRLLNEDGVAIDRLSLDEQSAAVDAMEAKIEAEANAAPSDHVYGLIVEALKLRRGDK